MSVTWNPSDQNGGVVCTNGNLTATTNNPGGGGVTYNGIRATAGKSSGKWYFEITEVVTNAYATAAQGIGTSAANLNGYLGVDAYGWGYQSYYCYHAGSYTPSQPALADGDVVMVALDLDAGSLWFGKNGTWLQTWDPTTSSWVQSDPSTEAYPQYTGISGTLFPMAVLGGNPAGSPTCSSVTANFAGPFAYTPPTGFTGYDATAPGPTGSVSFQPITASGFTGDQGAVSFQPMQEAASSVRGLATIAFQPMTGTGRTGAQGATALQPITEAATSSMPFSGAMFFEPMTLEASTGSRGAIAFPAIQASVQVLTGQGVSARAAFAALSSAARSGSRGAALLDSLFSAGHVLCGGVFSGSAKIALLRESAYVIAGSVVEVEIAFPAMEIAGDILCPWAAIGEAELPAVIVLGILETPDRFDNFILEFVEYPGLMWGRARFEPMECAAS